MGTFTRASQDPRKVPIVIWRFSDGNNTPSLSLIDNLGAIVWEVFLCTVGLFWTWDTSMQTICAAHEVAMSSQVLVYRMVHWKVSLSRSAAQRSFGIKGTTKSVQRVSIRVSSLQSQTGPSPPFNPVPICRYVRAHGLHSPARHTLILDLI